MNRNMQSESGKRSWVHRVLGYTIILLVVFLLGFVPIWLKSRETSRNLAAAEQQLTLTQMQNTLASATIDARRVITSQPIKLPVNFSRLYRQRLIKERIRSSPQRKVRASSRC